MVDYQFTLQAGRAYSNYLLLTTGGVSDDTVPTWSLHKYIISRSRISDALDWDISLTSVLSSTWTDDGVTYRQYKCYLNGQIPLDYADDFGGNSNLCACFKFTIGYGYQVYPFDIYIATMSYDANGGEADIPSETWTSDATVSTTIPTRDGYSFVGLCNA